MIEITNLEKKFNEQVIFKKVSLTVDKEIVGLIGANGTGKTTLFRCILGLIDYQGTITIDGLDVKTHALFIKEKLGYIPQYLPLWPDMKIKEAVKFFCRLRKVEWKRGQSLLEEFKLSQHAEKKLAHLSGGMRQKLSIVIALLPEPEIILLDEPTANLDAWATKDILNIMASWKGKKTVILASHRLEEVHAISDRMVQVSSGELIAPNLAEIGLAPKIFAGV